MPTNRERSFPTFETTPQAFPLSLNFPQLFPEPQGEMKSFAGSPACVPITFFTAQLVCSLKSALLFCGLAFRLCPCKAQGCVGYRQHSLSAGGLRPLASPESKGGKVGQSFSSGVAPLSRAHSRSQRIASARDWNLCSKRKSSSLSSNSWSTTKFNKGLVRCPIACTFLSLSAVIFSVFRKPQAESFV